MFTLQDLEISLNCDKQSTPHWVGKLELYSKLELHLALSIQRDFFLSAPTNSTPQS